MSFVFFDTETTGLKHGFDQIVHFAALRANPQLNEIERFEVRSRLLPHVLPHPLALRTNGLSIQRLTDQTLPSHYEMVTAIRDKLLSWSPAIFVGYNSIRFDEEMLRHAFFQTLYPAYLTSSPGNGRADVWGLLMAAAACTPACLIVPTSPEGRPTFRLDQIANANGIQDKAHDAMSDVVATLKLCRCVLEGSPEHWQRFIRFSNKAVVRDFVDFEDVFIFTEFFGNQAYHTPVVCIGNDPDQPNGRLCLNLLETNRLSAMSDEELHLEIAKKPSPIRRLRINAAPTLTTLYEATETMLGGISIDELETRSRLVKNNPLLCERLAAAYVAAREPHAPALHIEARLYDGFPGSNDESLMVAFHTAAWRDRLPIVQRFEDERLRYFGHRLVYFEARSKMPAALRKQLEWDLSRRLVDGNDGGLTIEEALRETERLLGEDKSDIDGVLEGYRSYLLDRAARVAAFRAES